MVRPATIHRKRRASIQSSACASPLHKPMPNRDASAAIARRAGVGQSPAGGARGKIMREDGEPTDHPDWPARPFLLAALGALFGLGFHLLIRGGPESYQYTHSAARWGGA